MQHFVVLSVLLPFLLLSNRAIGQASVPKDALAAWDRMSSVSRDGVWLIVSSANGTSISSTIKRRGEFWLLESSPSDGVIRRDVFGSEVAFCATRRDNERWTVPRVADKSDTQLTDNSPIVSRYLDAKHYVEFPFNFLPYQHTYSDFFAKCDDIRVTVDNDECTVAYDQPSEKGQYIFDMGNEWRLVSMEREIKASGVVFRHEILYLAELQKFVVNDFVSTPGAKSVPKLALSTRVTKQTEHPSIDEFSLAFYGIRPIVLNPSWWKRSSLWIALIGITCIILGVYIKYRSMRTVTE